MQAKFLTLLAVFALAAHAAAEETPTQEELCQTFFQVQSAIVSRVVEIREEAKDTEDGAKALVLQQEVGFLKAWFEQLEKRYGEACGSKPVQEEPSI